MGTASVPMPTAMPTALELSAQLQQRVTAFYAGDEKYAGEWLANFQRAGGAWHVCAERLEVGLPRSCDEELMQEFCAQTLARLARTFVNYHPTEAQKPLRDKLEGLLHLHLQGKQAIVWKQLALALACADLWLGSWAAVGPLSQGLPAPVQRELLMLPPELLFSDRALPLGDGLVREAAARGLYSSSESVLKFLVSGQAGDGKASLQVVAAWLGALRRSLRWLPGCDIAAPLRHLAACGQDLLARMAECPEAACEVAQQLVAWRGCDQELAVLLGGCLDTLFAGLQGTALLPLLLDLAADQWPRAALGEFQLDWRRVTSQAFEVLEAALTTSDPDSNDAETAFEVWQVFARTVHDACGPGALRPRLDAELDANYESPQKRSRRADDEVWRLQPERLAQDRTLPDMFSVLLKQLLKHLRMPRDPDQEMLVNIWDARDTATPTLQAWAELAGDAAKNAEWSAAAWAPLRQVAELVSVSDALRMVLEDFWCETEVVVWLSAVLAQSWPREQELAQVAQTALTLGVLDPAPHPWRALLWSSACSIAAMAAEDQCTAAVEWMLQRSPASVDATEEMLELVELPYARAVSRVCKRLPAGVMHAALGERIFQLAFARWPPREGPEALEAQGLLLQAMRHAVGGDAAVLCQSLAQTVLPKLRQAVDAEAEAAPSEAEPRWHGAQVLFSTLVALSPMGAPTTDAGHPAMAIWQENMGYVESALINWPMSSSTDQPAKAAAEALAAATQCLPALLPNGVQLLVESATLQELPDVQLRALKDVAVGVPLPPVNPAVAAALLAKAITGVLGSLLDRQAALCGSPSTLAALFALLAEAVRPSPPGMIGLGLCEDQLRKVLLAQPDLVIERCLAVVIQVLPECLSADAGMCMARFARHLLSGEDLQQPPQAPPAAHRSALVAALPPLFTAVCGALKSQEVFGEGPALAELAELLLAAGRTLPEDASTALAVAMGQIRVSDPLRNQFCLHVIRRSDYPKMEDWLEQLQKIVAEWRSERQRFET